MDRSRSGQTVLSAISVCVPVSVPMIAVPIPLRQVRQPVFSARMPLLIGWAKPQQRVDRSRSGPMGLSAIS